MASIRHSIDQSKLDSCLKELGARPGLAFAQRDFYLAPSLRITGSLSLLMKGKIVKEFDFAINTDNSMGSEALKEML